MEMTWYAYCITEQSSVQQSRVRRPFQFEQLRGVNASSVMGFPTGEFIVLVSAYDRNLSLNQQAVVEHARVVSECFRQATVLPFRFGTVFETDEALRHAVRANRKTFHESLERLRGKAEMHIKVMMREDGTVPEVVLQTLPVRTGGQYLERLHVIATRDRERQTKARAVSVQVNKLLAPLEHETSCKRVDSGLVIDIAHLIEATSLQKYQNRYNTATRQLKNCEITISGPWPPYHFMRGKLRTVNGTN
jgi:hypothetical protein